jgi:hypothetical protein
MTLPYRRIYIKKVPKMGAERTREYKLRKQQLLQANASTSAADNSTDVSPRNKTKVRKSYRLF